MMLSAKLRQISTGYTIARRFSSTISSLIDISEEVKSALDSQKPIVALESTIITHGMPYPENVFTAAQVEATAREEGAIPATIAVLEGRIKVGLSKAELEILGGNSQADLIKISRRDLSYVISEKKSGGTTVAGTMIISNLVGIPIFATGGIGGVHREGETTMDISADLIELGRTPIAVFSSGVKSILDIPKTLEFLETQGVFVGTYRSTTKDFPAFYTRKSGEKVSYNFETASEVAGLIKTTLALNLKSGMLVCIPIPKNDELDSNEIECAIKDSLDECRKAGIKGKSVTPFLLQSVLQITKGRSLEANKALIKNNVRVAAQVAVQLAAQLQTKSKANVPVSETLKHFKFQS